MRTAVPEVSHRSSGGGGCWPLKGAKGALAVLVFAFLGTHPVEAGELDHILAPIPGTSACWARTYTDAHLARHPRQKTTAIRFALSYTRAGHHREGEGEYSFSIGVTTRERTGFEGGLCQSDERGDVICGIDCDGGALSLRRSGSEGAIFVSIETGGIRLTECAGETAFTFDAEPDDRLFLLHPAPAADCTFGAGDAGE